MNELNKITPLVRVTETPDPLASLFKKLGIGALTYAHRPVFTVEEGRDIKERIPGGHTKNLFLKDKKDAYWLVTALWDTQIDLKWLPARLDAGRLSFGSAERLQAALGVTPGSVTPLALVNDSARQVQPVLDARLIAEEKINCHPLQNDMTTALSPQDLVKFMNDMGYNPVIVDFSAAGTN
jgi:Ala-tRNA(Pro) deacylase